MVCATMEGASTYCLLQSCCAHTLKKRLQSIHKLRHVLATPVLLMPHRCIHRTLRQNDTFFLLTLTRP